MKFSCLSPTRVIVSATTVSCQPQWFVSKSFSHREYDRISVEQSSSAAQAFVAKLEEQAANGTNGIEPNDEGLAEQDGEGEDEGEDDDEDSEDVCVINVSLFCFKLKCTQQDVEIIMEEPMSRSLDLR